MSTCRQQASCGIHSHSDIVHPVRYRAIHGIGHLFNMFTSLVPRAFVIISFAEVRQTNNHQSRPPSSSSSDIGVPKRDTVSVPLLSHHFTADTIHRTTQAESRSSSIPSSPQTQTILQKTLQYTVGADNHRSIITRRVNVTSSRISIQQWCGT